MPILQRAQLTDVEANVSLAFLNSYPVVGGGIAEGSCTLTDVEANVSLAFLNSFPVVVGGVPQGSLELTDVEPNVSLFLGVKISVLGGVLMSENEDLVFAPFDVGNAGANDIGNTVLFENEDLVFAPFDVGNAGANDVGETVLFENEDLVFAPFDYQEAYSLEVSVVLQENEDLVFAPFNHDNLGQPTNTGALCDTESNVSLAFLPSYEVPIIWVDAQTMTETQDGMVGTLVVETPILAQWTSTEAPDGMVASCLAPAFDFDIILDYTEAFIARSTPAHFIEQYKESTRLNAIALAFLPQFSQLEQSALDMLAYGYLSKATGASLDNIADIFSVVRGDKNDSELRIAIAQKSANRGRPTPNDIMGILRGFYGVESIKYVSGDNANIVFESYPVLDPENIYSIIGAGISVAFSELSETVLYGENDFAIVDEYGGYIYLEN